MAFIPLNARANFASTGGSTGVWTGTVQLIDISAQYANADVVVGALLYTMDPIVGHAVAWRINQVNGGSPPPGSGLFPIRLEYYDPRATGASTEPASGPLSDSTALIGGLAANSEPMVTSYELNSAEQRKAADASNLAALFRAATASSTRELNGGTLNNTDPVDTGIAIDDTIAQFVNVTATNRQQILYTGVEGKIVTNAGNTILLIGTTNVPLLPGETIRWLPNDAGTLQLPRKISTKPDTIVVNTTSHGRVAGNRVYLTAGNVWATGNSSGNGQFSSVALVSFVIDNNNFIIEPLRGHVKRLTIAGWVVGAGNDRYVYEQDDGSLGTAPGTVDHAIYYYVDALTVLTDPPTPFAL